MKCIDCGESIIESERRGARSCVACKGVMHGECAMATPGEDDVCEACLTREGLRFRAEMKSKGAEA